MMVSSMNRFENISVRGFRRLQNIELETRNLIVMIGANGAGKTSFLDILSILAASASGNLQNLLSLKGLSYEVRDESLTQQRNPNRAEPFKYIESQGLDVKYFQERSGLLRPDWEHNPLETSLSQVPKMYREPENLRKSLASCTYYGALDVSEKSPIRLPQAMRPAKLPGASGENLVPCLYDLRETDRDRFEMVENIISAAF